MKRNTFVLIGLYLIFYYGGLKAQVVSQETARQVADNFFYSQFPLKSLEHMDVLPLGNRTITTGMHGYILSGESVTLTSGFEIQAGADVYIDIKDMHCNDRCYLKEQQDNQKCSSMPQKVSNVDNVPIVSKLFRDGQILIHRDGKTYTISGQRIK